MAKMTKAQARKRLNEARKKVIAVYMTPMMGAVSTQDMVALDKLLTKCIKRIP